MAEKIENPPAFPSVVNGFADVKLGMSLRDWFAGQALMSLLTTPGEIADRTYAIAAGLSYKFADAMLAERTKSGEA